MAKVEIYTWTVCPYCVRAKDLMQRKGIEYTEHNIDGDDDARAKMVERAQGRRSLPQIFINDKPIGGFDDLSALDKSGELEKLLAA
ncbi:MAG: glutaredoxin 3 [Alphaproteobacteria bacterium]|nr:glutaredoxin 3 [Alphaproteobacteria bacterium]